MEERKRATNTFLPDPAKGKVIKETISTVDTLGGALQIKGQHIGVHHIAKRVINAEVPPA